MRVPRNDERGRRSALTTVALGIFCIQLDSFALNLALPSIGHDLRATEGHLQWAISAYLLSVGTFMLGSGRLGDLYGRRLLLMLGLAAFGTGSLLCALAPNLPLLVGARVLQGVGAALIMPVGLALLTNVYPVETRSRAIGLAVGLGGIATACGPFVGGLLTAVASWRLVFWINVPVVLAAMCCLRETKESRDENSPKTVDVPGLVCATLALACLTGYVDRAPSWGWLSTGSTILLLATSALSFLFVQCERSAPLPLVNPTLFTNRPFVALTISGAVANTATVVFLFVVPLSLQGSWQLPPLLAGTAFLAPSVLVAAAGPVAGRIRPERATTAMALSLLVAAAGLLAAAGADALVTYLAAVAICGAGLGVGNALTLVATQGVVHPTRAGEASGVTKTAITVAAGLGVVLAAPVATPGAAASASATALASVALGALATSGVLFVLIGTGAVRCAQCR